MKMIKVLSINKNGNRVLSYKCTDGNSIKNISKDDLIKLINSGQVSNAKVQKYKNNYIVRVKDTTKNTVSLKNKNVRTLKDLIQDAKARGIEYLSLDGLEVSTKTFEIRKKNTNGINSDIIQNKNNAQDITSNQQNRIEAIKFVNDNTRRWDLILYAGNTVYLKEGNILKSLDLNTFKYRDMVRVEDYPTYSVVGNSIYLGWCNQNKIGIYRLEDGYLSDKCESNVPKNCGRPRLSNIIGINDEYAMVIIKDCCDNKYIYILDRSSGELILRDFKLYVLQRSFICGYD